MSGPDGDGGSYLGVLRKDAIPLACTCGIRGSHLIADPTEEEEQLMDVLATTTVNGPDKLIGMPFSLA